MPEELARIALQNKRLVYGILFAASAATLRTIAADERHLGAEIGFLSVLHTWGQDLRHHPHVHCVVPGGGLRRDGSWVACRPGFFLPVRVLSAMFRGKFVAALRSAFERGQLRLQGALEFLRDPTAFAAYLDRVMAKKWVVYSKPPFGGPEQVLKYLARYTHRVAIGNRRIVDVDATTVKFLWRDRANGDRQRTMALPGVEFLRRFLLHVLPRGFTRLRHYGFLANRARATRLAECRLRLGATMPDTGPATIAPCTPRDEHCPACRSGRLVRQSWSFGKAPEVADTSWLHHGAGPGIDTNPTSGQAPLCPISAQRQRRPSRSRVFRATCLFRPGAQLSAHASDEQFRRVPARSAVHAVA
jgi:hypothetical protein